MAQRQFTDELLEEGLKDPEFAEFYTKGRLRRELASALVRLRKAIGLTQESLGKTAGWKQPYVARLERGDSDALAAVERIGRFATVCDASTVLLFVDQQTGVVRSSVAISDDARAKEYANVLNGFDIRGTGSQSC